MRKKIALLCAIIMMVTTIMPSFTMAEGEIEARFKIGTSTGTFTYAVGDTVSVIAKLTSSKSISSMLTVMYFDSTKLELDVSSVKANSVLLGTIIDTSVDGRIGIVAADHSTDNPMQIDGEIFTANFTVKKGAAGSTEIKLTAEEMFDGTADTEPITFDEATATLTIVNPCTGITLDKSTLSIERGKSGQLTATTVPTDTTDKVVWSSAENTIATVDSNGKVSGVKVGETTITATCGNQTASCEVTVTKPQIPGKVTIEGKAFFGVTLTAVYDEGNADNVKYTWYRKDEANSIGTGKEYKIVEADIGKQLYVVVTSSEYTGELTSNPTATVEKAPRKLTVTIEGNGEVAGAPKNPREGDKITLTATPSNFNHKFVEWQATGVTLTDVNNTTISFTMGKNDVEIKAKFKEKDAVSYGFGTAEFIYNKDPQAPAFNPNSGENLNMDVKVEYFARGGNTPIEKPINAGKYTMQVTYTSSAASGFKTTVATCDFEIKKANQTEPAAPTVTDIEPDSFVVAFDEKQEYAINTTGDAPTKWAARITTTGLNPATVYYVFTRKAGSENYNPSPAVNAMVTTAHTYEWKLDDTNNAVATVRVGATLPPELTATIKNTGTGELTGVQAKIIDNNTNFTLVALSSDKLASNGTLNIKVNPKNIATVSEGEYTATVTVSAKDVGDITINFTIKVTAKDPANISGINDTTVTFNGETQGIDLRNAKVNGKDVKPSDLTVTYTKGGATIAAPRDAGVYNVAIKYEDNDNIGSTTAQLIINKKDVTVEGFKAQSKVYDGNADAEVDSTNAKLVGIIEGTDVYFDKSGLTFKFDDKKVGTNKTVTNTKPITLNGTDADNYNLKNPTVELTADITAKPVTVTATVEDKTYDGLKNNAVVKLSAPELIKGDQVQFDNVTGTYVTADAGDAVEVKVTYITKGEDASNYSLNVVKTATGKVKKADLNVTLTEPPAVTYDGNTHGVSDVKDDRVKADKDKTLYTLTYDNKDALPVDAGTYKATAKLTAEGSKNYNLKVEPVDGVDVKINKAGMNAKGNEYIVAFTLAGAQTRELSDLQLTPANVSGKWSVVTGENEILDGDAKIDGANLVFNIKSGLTTDDIGKKAELTLTFTPDKNYKTVTATVTVTLAQDTYNNSISPALPEYVKLGEALDLSGVKLVTKFGSGAPEQQLDVNDAANVEVTTTYNPAATGETALGVKTVTFTDKANSGINYTHSFTVVDVLEGVKLEADPTAYNYKLKEASSIGFDGKVHAVYKSGARKALNHADVVLTMSDGTVVDSAKEARLLNTLGTATITLTYTEKYFDRTSDKQSVAITVSVTADPVKPDGKPNAEGFAVTPIPDAGKKMEYKNEAENEVKPEDVQGKLAYAAPGALEEEVKKNPAFNNVGNGDVVYENISFKDENGKSVTFANGKMQVTVPYPADSDKGDEFVMLIPDGEGKMKAIVPQKTADGLQFEIENSNVTFAIGWYTPAPSPVLPTEPERDPEDNFWNEVYWTLLRSGQGSVITANAGYYDRVPQGVLRAVDISGNTLIINSAFGMQVVVNPGALEKLGMYRIFYPISYLNEMLRGGKINGSGTTGITVGVLMPTTGDATVVEHPYTMTPASAGFIKGMENTANARPVIETADGVDVLEGAQRNDGAVIGGGMLIVLGLLALLGAAYVTMRRRGSRN